MDSGAQHLSEESGASSVGCPTMGAACLRGATADVRESTEAVLTCFPIKLPNRRRSSSTPGSCKTCRQIARWAVWASRGEAEGQEQASKHVRSMRSRLQEPNVTQLMAVR